MQEQKINKDLILREQLAMERTGMANDRTLLAFIRTSLYFAIAGMTINELADLRYGTAAETIFWIASVVLLATGITNYLRQRRKLNESKKHIGNYVLDAEEDL